MRTNHPIFSHSPRLQDTFASTKWTAALTAIALLSSTLIAVAQETARTPNREPVDPNAVIRALVADPDFKKSTVPAENAWDFNAPNTVPGFGSIDTRNESEPQTSQTASR